MQEHVAGYGQKLLQNSLLVGKMDWFVGRLDVSQISLDRSFELERSFWPKLFALIIFSTELCELFILSFERFTMLPVSKPICFAAGVNCRHWLATLLTAPAECQVY